MIIMRKKIKLVFKTLLKILNECPVLLIHNTLNEIISFEKYETLSKKFKECVKCFQKKEIIKILLVIIEVNIIKN